MLRKRLFIVGSVAVLCAAVGVAVAASARAVTGTQTITVVPEFLEFSAINTDGKAIPGDIFISRARLWNRAHTKVVGTAYQSCIETFPSPNVDNGNEVCDYVFDLGKRGQITSTLVKGRNITSPGFAITGGSGDFQNVRGEWHVVQTSSERYYALHLLP
jgi:hypothetical protein